MKLIGMTIAYIMITIFNAFIGVCLYEWLITPLADKRFHTILEPISLGHMIIIIFCLKYFFWKRPDLYKEENKELNPNELFIVQVIHGFLILLIAYLMQYLI